MVAVTFDPTAPFVKVIPEHVILVSVAAETVCSAKHDNVLPVTAVHAIVCGVPVVDSWRSHPAVLQMATFETKRM